MTITFYSPYYFRCIIQSGNSAKLNTSTSLHHCICCIKKCTDEERRGNVLWAKMSSWISNFTPNLFSLQRACCRHQNIRPCESAARLMATAQHILSVFVQLSCFSWMSKAVTLERSRTFSRRNYANNVLALPFKVMRGDGSGAVQCADRCLRTVKRSPRFERQWIIYYDSRNEITDQTTCWCCGKVLNYNIITYDVLDSRDSAPRCHNRGTKQPIPSLDYR